MSYQEVVMLAVTFGIGIIVMMQVPGIASQLAGGVALQTGSAFMAGAMLASRPGRALVGAGVGGGGAWARSKTISGIRSARQGISNLWKKRMPNDISPS